MKNLALFCSLLLTALGLCAAENQPVNRVKTSEPVVALTFDDGPHAENTKCSTSCPKSV
jgi:peptidoglycan/xylan/chitin deacetylase (PgdA/CDA1 family)